MENQWIAFVNDSELDGIHSQNKRGVEIVLCETAGNIKVNGGGV
jgi:hypothetical protein